VLTSLYEARVTRHEAQGELCADRADRLFRAHHSRLVGYVTRMCGKRAVAEDVVGEVWEIVCRNGVTVPDAEAFGWLTGVARHRLWRQYRIHSQEVPAESVGETTADLDRQRSPYVFHAELPTWLSDAVEALPPTQRSTMQMVADGIPTLAAASWLDKTSNAIRCARSAAVRRLRPQLAALMSAVSHGPMLTGGCLECGCMCGSGCGCGCGCCPYPHPLPALTAATRREG